MWSEARATEISTALADEFPDEWRFTVAPSGGQHVIMASKPDGSLERVLINEIDVSSFRRYETAARDAQRNRQLAIQAQRQAVPGLDMPWVRPCVSGTNIMLPARFQMFYRRWVFMLLVHVINNQLVVDVHGAITFNDGDTTFRDATLATNHQWPDVDGCVGDIARTLQEAVDGKWESEPLARRQEIHDWEAMIRAKADAGSPATPIEPVSGATTLPDYLDTDWLQKVLNEHPPMQEDRGE